MKTKNNSSCNEAKTKWVWRPKQMQESKPKPTTTKLNPPTTKPNQVWRPKNTPTQAKPQVVKASSSAKEISTPHKM